MQSAPPALEMRGIAKSFAGNTVLSDVNLRAYAGEVLALLGENGAGKSTLMKILAGVHRPDAGEVLLEGATTNFHSPADALKHGIAMIYQELSLAPHLSVAENIFLGREPSSLGGIINRAQLLRNAEELLGQFGFKIDPGAKVGSLSTAKRQLVEISRAVAEARKIVVMDEPTSSLSNSEVEDLFRVIALLKKRGLAIIYISHRLEELDEIADKVTILRDGEAVYSGNWGEISREDAIRHMVGRELTEVFPTRSCKRGQVRLKVRNLSKSPLFSNVSFEAYAGEILGIAGLAGAGRTELVEAVFGTHPATGGEIEIDGKRVSHATPPSSLEAGLSLLTEDRKKTGLCLNQSIATNLTLANIDALVSNGVFQAAEEQSVTESFISKLSIKPPVPRKIVSRLSGGNQQKVLLGRWLFAKTNVFLLDEPTRGVDVGARTEIYRAINEMAEAGAAIVMVSSDLPELLGMADRILVMRRGKMVAELDARKTTQEEILQHAAIED